jgi:hypothetical protein
MGGVRVHFIGLHLIDNDTPCKKTVAVIHADHRDVKRRCWDQDITLDRHRALIEIAGKILKFDWPELDTPGIPDVRQFELKGKISFSPDGTVDDRRGGKLLKVNHECSSFILPVDFFGDLGAGDKSKHALVSITAGRLSLFKIEKSKAIHMRVAFENPKSFEIRRHDGSFIELDLSEDATITFLNTEPESVSANDNDWLWYMHATNNGCCGKPNPNDVPSNLEEIKRLDPAPITLGCSNSNWP